jgi:alpha-L-fucosidase
MSKSYRGQFQQACTSSSRRNFLIGGGAALATTACFARTGVLQAANSSVYAPSYLRGYESDYAADPRRAATKWFVTAHYGLSVHYGLASLLPGGKKYSFPNDPSQSELRKHYTAEKFDANAIANLAVASGMSHIRFTPYHGGGPYNFRSKVAHPNTVDDLPAKRDLVGELADACRRRGLGLFLYVHCNIAQSNDEVWPRNQEIFQEWLTQYGPLAGFWFDTEKAYYDDKSLYPRLDVIYGMIRSKQPQALISFCHGVTGEEDFITCEHHFYPLSDIKYVPDKVKRKMARKPVEVTTTLQLDQKDGRGTKMWFNVEGAYHRTPEDVWKILAEMRRDHCNLSLNTGLLGDGSINPDDERTLRAVGKRLRAGEVVSGYPTSHRRDMEQVVT